MPTTKHGLPNDVSDDTFGHDVDDAIVALADAVDDVLVEWLDGTGDPRSTGHPLAITAQKQGNGARVYRDKTTGAYYADVVSAWRPFVRTSRRLEVTGNNGGNQQTNAEANNTIIQTVAGIDIDNVNPTRFHVDFDIFTTEADQLDVNVALVVNGVQVKKKVLTIPAQGESAQHPKVNVQLEKTFAYNELALGASTVGFRIATGQAGRNIVLVNSNGQVFTATSHEF